MKLEVTEGGNIKLGEVYASIILETDGGSKMSVCMRDNGFEINLNGAKYVAQGNVIIEMP